MLSGNITIRNKTLPLTWSGEKAEHLAQGHIDTPHVHPYLHIAAQQFARKGKIQPQQGKRYLSYFDTGSQWAVTALLQQGKFIVICSCYIKHYKDFDSLKNKGVGKVKTKRILITPADIHFTADEEKAINVFGFTTEMVAKGFCNIYNKKPLNKKR